MLRLRLELALLALFSQRLSRCPTFQIQSGTNVSVHRYPIAPERIGAPDPTDPTGTTLLPETDTGCTSTMSAKRSHAGGRQWHTKRLV